MGAGRLAAAPGVCLWVGLGCDFDGEVAPGAVACGRDRGDAEPVARAAGQVFDGDFRARGDLGVNPRGVGRRVGTALDDVGACAADGVPGEVNFSFVVAERGGQVRRRG